MSSLIHINPNTCVSEELALHVWHMNMDLMEEALREAQAAEVALERAFLFIPVNNTKEV